MPNVVKSKKIPESIRQAYLTQRRRRAYPYDYFLLVEDDGKRMFPYREPESGRIHCGLLKGAITRAAQYGYSWVEDRARGLYAKYCKAKKDYMLERVGIVKESFEKGIVLGVVAAPGVVDKQGDEITKEAIEEACWDYNVNFGVSYFSHRVPLAKEEVELLESYVAPSDFRVGDITVKEGTWLWRCRIKDKELQKMVADGRITGLSLGGVIMEAGE